MNFNFKKLVNFYLFFATLLFFSYATASVEGAVSGLDSEVTDIQLRVKSGAKSKWSSTLFLNYAGAALADPFAENRPNPEGYSVPEPVSAAGSIGFRYRQNKHESLYFATGFYQTKPLRSEQQKLEINTPQISYNNTFLYKTLQVSQGLQLYISTQDYLRAVGDMGSVGASWSGVKYLEDSKWSVGTSVIARATIFDKNEEALRSLQTDYGFSVSPNLQYMWHTNLTVNTVLNILTFNHFRDEADSLKMKKLPVSQSLGLGWAIKRDFYFSPYLNFDPAKLSRQTTAVNFSLTVNL